VTVWLAVSALLGAGLLGLALGIEERRRRAPRLPPAPPPKPAPHAEVTALLPVRDEERDVLACVDTLLAQTVRPAVRVIDDGSTDATASRVAGRAAAEPRLTLLPAGPLPDGWRGKVHALWVGSQDVSTPWILTTDADARHSPDLLARALAAAREGELDLVSLAGTQEARGPGENLLVPPVFALLDALLGDWQAAASGAGPPVANGQFMLLRRSAWEGCGGFEIVRAESLDDLAAAARLREGGHRTGFIREPGLTVRMYRGWPEASRGWRRNLGGMFHDLRIPATTLAALLLPPLALAASLLAGRWVEAALLWTAGASASALVRNGSHHRPAWGLLYPLDALALAWVLALGVLDRRRGRLASWKGREIRI
jgi:cellulose synthase/poly-beta-1,6-N-acetylglucosamine synthase-like glycosyltransferase